MKSDVLSLVVVYLVLLGALHPALVSSQAGGCESKFAQLDNITCAEDGPPEQQGYCIGTRRGKGFWVSSAGPIAMNAPKGLSAEVAFFQRLFYNISSETRDVRRRNHFRAHCPEDSGANEDLSKLKRNWRNSALNHEARVGFEKSNSSCFTEIRLSAARSKIYWEHMVSFGNYLTRTGEILQEKAKPIEGRLSSYFNQTLSCWLSIHSSMSRAVETQAFLCTLRNVAGFRSPVESGFNVGVTLTNHPVNISLPETARIYLNEKWSADEASGKIIAQPLPSYKHGEIDTRINSSTTVLFTWGGSPKISTFIGIPIATNPAVQHVLQIAEKFEEGVFDSVAVSNLAILVFPAVLSLLPVALFGITENPALIIGYAIATDILTVLPLAIKGIEMISFTQREHTGCVSWNVGVEVDSGLALTEMWCAGCAHRPQFRLYGPWLLAAAFAFMFAGFLFEYLAYKWVKRRQFRKRKIKSRWRNRTVWAEHTCIECNCEYYSDSSLWSHYKLKYQTSS